MSEVVLKVEKLTKDYGAYRAVDSISFEIKRGQVLGLLGANGAGKTTTIQMLVGITNYSAGRVFYFGQDFAAHRQNSLQRINATSAYNTLLGRITVRENLMTFAGLYQVSNRQAKIAELLDKFEIGHLAGELYTNLSAGERTRVNLAKSLLNDPELILMDEPTASLDPDIADKTLTWIEELRASNNLSILFTSHNMAEVERICDEVIFLEKGKIVSRGAPSDHTGKMNEVQVILNFKGDEAKLDELLAQHKFAHEISGKEVAIKTTKEQAAEAISLISQAGFKLTDTEIKKPTLEQVFLDIARRKR